MIATLKKSEVTRRALHVQSMFGRVSDPGRTEGISPDPLEKCGKSQGPLLAKCWSSTSTIVTCRRQDQPSLFGAPPSAGERNDYVEMQLEQVHGTQGWEEIQVFPLALDHGSIALRQVKVYVGTSLVFLETKSLC